MVYRTYTHYMTATTIKVPSELRDRLNEEARRTNTTVAGVIEALVVHREKAERLRAMREAMSAASAADRAAYLDEVREWDRAATDGLDDPVRD